MNEHHQDRSDIEQIMRRAAVQGHDPERVARAVGLRPAPPTALDPAGEGAARTSVGARVRRRLARRSPPDVPQRATTAPD